MLCSILEEDMNNIYAEISAAKNFLFYFLIAGLIMTENMKSKILSFNDLIEYNDDAIVSKIIVNSEKGSITIFAFDEGQGLSEHTAPFDATVQIIEGEAEIIISEESFKLSMGNMIIMPANKPHAVKSITKFKMILTMIK